MVSCPEGEKQEWQAGWSTNEKDTHLVGLGACGLGARTQRYRALDSFPVTDPHGFSQENSHHKPCSGFSGCPGSLYSSQSTCALPVNHTSQAPATASVQDQCFSPASPELQASFPNSPSLSGPAGTAASETTAFPSKASIPAGLPVCAHVRLCPSPSRCQVQIFGYFPSGPLC